MSSKLEREILGLLQPGDETIAESIRKEQNEAPSSENSDHESDAEDSSSEDDVDIYNGTQDPNAHFDMQHNGPQTGPKGVIADKMHHDKMQAKSEREKRDAAQKQYEKACLRNLQTNEKTIWTNTGDKNNKSKAKYSDDENDGDDDLLKELENEDDRFYQDYLRQRMGEFVIGGNHGQGGPGRVETMSPSEYVNVVDGLASSSTPIIVHLFDETSATSNSMDRALSKLSLIYTKSRFIRTPFKECGLSNNVILPTLLIYKLGELTANLVGASLGFDDPALCTEKEVKGLLNKHDALF
ncbi:hypothetical protein H4219_000857 [Mycoemilia scoparia]|uniref:Phosducin domain-containing protein n=1 Tax=Mycoemilia scoparia TaxID=417184 RepID=A0A9W8DWK9_9FUNG|nr:hypothetical protein H4219_000857 [Mycoemilia scoparia]